MTGTVKRSTRLTRLPKAHLHVHLEGAARAATIAEFANRHHRPPPAVAAFSNLPGFVDCFRQVTDVIATPDDLQRVIREFVADEAAEGVRYSEPMVGPWLYADRFGWSVPDTFAFIDDAFQQAARRHDVEVRYLLGVNWARPPDWIEQAARFAVEHATRNVAGLGLAGLEPTDGFQRYSRAAAIVRAHGLLVVPHLGETQGPQSIRAAVAAMRPHRIAHGVRTVADPGLLDELADRRIVCDVCPTSNVRLGVTSELASHPLPRMLRHGVPVTLNADDPMLLSTTLTSEYKQVGQAFGLTDHQLADLAAEGASTAGMTETTRTALRSSIRRWLADDHPTKKGHHG
ncbi:adenosine deaminase [Nocardia sp. NPDC047038]|uniref:adenosine deaminase n=1 Tax=Nocardia sp. NPDC047038 TaxID=3154338 RepID=UPI0033D208AB